MTTLEAGKSDPCWLSSACLAMGEALIGLGKIEEGWDYYQRCKVLFLVV